MDYWKVKQFSHVFVANDGLSVNLLVENIDGTRREMEVPYQQVDWLQQALLSACDGAYQLQLKTGRLQAVRNADEDRTVVVESFRTLLNATKDEIVVQVSVRPGPSVPLSMGSFAANEEMARKLGESLLSLADEMKQWRLPS